MPDPSPVNGLTGHLQSSESWGRQQALELLRQNLTQTLSSLTPVQQREYVRLQREAVAAHNAVEAENTRLIERFNTLGLAQLRSKLGGLDPHNIFLHTRYLEKLEPPLPWEPRSSASQGLGQLPRFRRTVDEWKYRTHISRLSLWQAACLNFDFSSGTPQASGHSFVDASYLTGVDEKQLSVSQFIAICRDLDLGGQLHSTLAGALGAGGKLHGLIQTSARQHLLFEALEAYRDRANSGVTQALYDALVGAIDGSGAALAFDTLSLDIDRTILPAVPLTASGATIAVPLLLIQVSGLGVVSYFPFRPGGALRYHIDAKSAGAQFITDLTTSHRDGDLGWFARQLPVNEVNQFKHLLRKETRPEGLSLVAGFLYDAFHTLFPKQALEHLRFVTDAKTARPQTLTQALGHRHIQLYQANLSLLATARSARDVQAVIDGAAAIASEIMELLMTPMPGGVSGLNRLMQAVVFGNLAYSLIIGSNEAAKGQASDFAAAMADVLDLAINGLLITSAGRVHRQRIEGLMQRLGDPRKVPGQGGRAQLWKPDIQPYAIANPELLDGHMPNAQGLYLINGQHYARVQQGQQHVVAKVNPDTTTQGFVLTRKNGNGFAAPIVFEPKQQAWRLDLHGASQLSDTQLLAQMLPNGDMPVPEAQLRRLLRSTAVSRASLDKIWAGEPPPINLVHASRRVQVDRVIEQLSSGFHRSASLPAHAGSAVLSLLTQLPAWPAEAIIHLYDAQGTLLESHAAHDSATHPIHLKRKEDGTYIALDAADSSVASPESLFELILRQQPPGSTLGKEGSPQLTETQRIARLRVQIGALASRERIALFEALTRYAGLERHQVPTDEGARVFVPVKAAPLPRPETEHREQHRTALRIDAVIDGLYHARAFNRDTDLWAREFARSLLLERVNRHFVVTEMSGAHTRYKSSGPDDTTVELLHYGGGRYEAYDMRNAGTIPVAPAVDSFYLAIASVLQPHERTALGMNSATDAQGLRETLGDLMSERRSPAGLVSLLDTSLGQYQQNRVLPIELKANPEGLYDWQGERLMPLYGAFYPVTYDASIRKWRLKHPHNVGVDTPRLEHNGHGAWRLESENPLTWDDHRLFSRLGTEFNVGQQTAERILKLTNTPPRTLREVHCAGLPPPPLLKDSSKRFAIEGQILHFIQAMSSYSATRTARPALQLLLVCALPQWPASHVLELHDDSGRTVAHYPAANAGAPTKIRLSQAQSRSLEPLLNLVRDDTLTRALLDELPEGQQERLFKLAKKIAEHAYRERSQLFDTLYAQSERNGNGLHERLRKHYPQLPSSALQALLDHATPKELKQLNDKDWLPLRLDEQARLTANDLRLNRAFEGLYLSTLANPDSETIILNALKMLAQWPAEVRLDIHRGSAAGPLLESAGHLAGSMRKVIARVDGRYRAHDAQGAPIGDAPGDLLTAIWQVLDDGQREALGLDDSGDLGPLRSAIADWALNQRIAIKDLLGLPHIPYWLQPPMRVDSSFTAYMFGLQNSWLFSGRTPPMSLVNKVIELYPRFSTTDARNFINAMDLSEPAMLLELQRRKAEYQALEFGLDRWATAEYPIDADDPLGLNLGRRRFVARQILQAWRRETRQIIANGLFDAYALELQLDGNSLPDADFILSTRGFEHIEYLKIAGDHFPATGNDFLGKFAHLKSLRLDCMLTELPTSVTAMTQLEQLNLSDNSITLTEDSRQRLAGMTRLEELNLDNNPLMLTPDVSRMQHLLNLNLRNTGIREWPIGAERLTQLHSLLLQVNQITHIPDSLLNNEAMRAANRGTFLHDNPLNQDSLNRLSQYRQRTRAPLGGALPGAAHVPPTQNEVTPWLQGVPSADQAQRKAVWEQLRQHEGASPDDAFQVLRDLTKAYDYLHNTHAFVARVWRLLQGMAESHELREQIFLNTYVSGTCGDGAILTFIDMELQHKQYQAMAQPSTHQANRDLLALAHGMFYLRRLDQFAEDHLRRLRFAGANPDDAEVKLYLRLHFADAFNLPILKENRLYSPGSALTARDLADITREMQAVKDSNEVEQSVRKEKFWIRYLARNIPEPFATIEDTARAKLEALQQEVPDKLSMEYQERRLSINEIKQTEHERLVDQLTRAALSGSQRVDTPQTD